MKATRETNGNKPCGILHLPVRWLPFGVVRRAVAGVELPCGCNPFPVGLPCVPFCVCFGCRFHGLGINTLIIISL